MIAEFRGYNTDYRQVNAITAIAGGTTMNFNFREQIALKEFAGFLSDHLADNCLYSCLFGSKARGDGREDSDL